MPMMTPEQYEASLRKMNFKVYLQGERVENTVDHPIIRPSMNSVKATYAMAQAPEHEVLMTATSHLTGKKINRFCHLHRSTEDLINKVKMQRLLGRATASCFQRCVGMDALNALDTTTFEMDRDLGTKYHERFETFLLAVQENDWTVDGAMTDVKGDRGLPPSKQVDPDMFLHVVERRADGIVVKGAKAHQTGAINSHWIIVMPTASMGPDDTDYAVSFAIPADAQGVLYIYGRQSCDTRKLEGGEIDVGNHRFGGHEALMVFDNVFVPWENVFMCGEHEFSGMLVERFAGYHRQSYGGCKVGVGDVLIGAAALAADYNGAAKASHVKDKLVEMTHLNENSLRVRDLLLVRGREDGVGHFPNRSSARQCLQAERHSLPVRDRPSRRGHRRRSHGDHAVGEGFPQSRDQTGDREIPEGCERNSGRASHARSASYREHHTGHGSCWLSHRIDARRRQPAGPAYHDCAPGKSCAQEGVGQEGRRNFFRAEGCRQDEGTNDREAGTSRRSAARDHWLPQLVN